MQDTKNRSGLVFAGAVIAAVTASLCCILPVVAVALGLTGFAASRFFETWRPYLLALTFALLGLGIYLAYRPRTEACEPGTLCARPNFVRWNRAILWLVTVLVVVLAAFPYYSGAVARAIPGEEKVAPAPSANLAARAVMNVEGMDCGGCAALLEKKLSQIPGVRRAEVNFERKQASVDYDAQAVAPSRFAEIIKEAGFKASPVSSLKTPPKGS